MPRRARQLRGPVERVRPSGLYIVEDLHTSYQPSFGGGFREPETSVEFFKGVADLLNADHIAAWRDALDGEPRSSQVSRPSSPSGYSRAVVLGTPTKPVRPAVLRVVRWPESPFRGAVSLC